MSAGLKTILTPFMGKLICLLYISLSMAFWKELKRQLIKDTPEEKQDPVSGLVFNLEAENPTPREEAGSIPIVKEAVSVPLKLGPLGSVKKPRGALNLLKIAVTLFMLVDVCAALFFVSSSMVITGAALAVFIPNAVFLFMLRGKL